MVSITYAFVALSTLVAGAVSQNYFCEDIYPPQNGKLTMGRYNAYYIVRCDLGYVADGNILVKCINGQWENFPPKCVQNPEVEVCPDLETPVNGYHDCEEGPKFLGTNCRFSCHEGYRLVGVIIRVCMSNRRWSSYQPRCVPITSIHCPVPPPLKNGRIIGCSPNNVPTVGKTCHYSCNEGYVLQGYPAFHCQASGKLTDVEGNESFPKCVGLYQSSSPSYEYEPSSSDHGLQDRVEGITANYRVRSTRIPAARPESSWNDLSCSVDNGGCEHSCVQRQRRVKCTCRSGYGLAVDRRSCVDIDECARETKNQCQQECHNILGSYTCSCNHGYRKVGEYKCEGCKKNSYWLEEEDRCEECPENSYTDSEAKLSIDDCLCLAGFTGIPKAHIPCQDIDECADNNFYCSHRCVNTPGSAFCSCPVGFTLDVDNRTCIDIDECSIKNGGCQGICHNSDGSFSCSCPEGYTASNKDHYSCDDVDECLENNGGCAQKCNNYPGGHYCSCESGYRLDSGLQDCSDVRCPSPIAPQYSTVECKLRKITLPQIESYAVGTVCTYGCLKGFKMIGSSNKVKCQENGTWAGALPQCKSQHCSPLAVPENGEVHPPSCSRRGNSVKQKCTFTCHPGYQLKGKSVYTCKNNLKWPTEEIPECLPAKIQPTIKCPEDVSAELHPGRDSHNITLGAPITNMEKWSVKPEWVSVENPVQFPAGTTTVIFTAFYLNTNRFARCNTYINIIDKEAPIFNFCPEPIEVGGVGVGGTLVTWDEPAVSDNVKVESIKSTLDPNSILTPGTYNVEYIAKDAAGNVASCSFGITINRTHCNDLADPANGFANCMDWMSGKVCSPACNDGYAQHPSDNMFYSCDDSGTWEPADVISDCLKYISPVSSECPDGYELVENSEIEDEICVECRRNTIWSASTKKCEELDSMLVQDIY